MQPSLREVWRTALRAAAGALGSLRQNLTIGLLAVGLAVALWVFITDQENPTTTVDVAPPVEVSAVNVAEGLAVLGAPPPVDVRASAPRDVAERFDAEDFRATIDLAGLALGTHDVPVRVEHVGGGRRVRIERVTPPRVRVTLQALRRVTAPVRAEVGLRPPAGYESGEISVEPVTVEISGPEDLVGRVAEVVARVDLATATAGVRASVDLVATNGSGTTIEGVNIEPRSVEVRVDIRQTLFERAFAVQPSVTGVPAAGYAIDTIEVEPQVVLLRGPLAALDGLEGAPTLPIDVTGAVADIIQEVTLDLPEGVAAVTAGQPITLRIHIAAATGRAIFGVPPAFEGVGDGLTARAVTPIVEVEVEGPLPQLRGLGPAGLTAIASLAGLTVGRHDVEVSARVPAGLTVVAVRPQRVTVEIARP